MTTTSYRVRGAGSLMPALQPLALLTMALLTWQPVIGQAAQVPQANEAPLRTVLEVSPARVPDPVLKYRLFPGYGERRPGNAAVFYGKVTAEQRFYFRQEYWEAWNELNELSAEDKLASPKLDQFAVALGYAMLRDGALCDDCDWQHPLRDENALAVLLPEVQQTRSFARLLVPQAIFQIREQNLNGCIETLQTGFVLGVNVAKTPILVSKLVGIAIHGMMREPLELLIEQPGTPSLYWAMAHFPRPLIDLRDALEAEADVMLRHMPGMDEIDSEATDPAFWARQYARFLEFGEYLGADSRLGTDQPLANVAMAMVRYPEAKQVLLDSGWTQESVDQLPVGKCLLLAEQARHRDLAQSAAALASLPWHQVTPELLASDSAGQYTLMADVLQSAVAQIRTAQMRTERWWAALQTVEALRHYAATHDGQLPDSLDQLTETPAPDDPATGKPFEYQRDGNVAIIEGPDLEPQLPFGYEVRLRPAK